MRYVTIRVNPNDMHAAVAIVDQRTLAASTIQGVAIIEALTNDVVALSQRLGERSVPHIIETRDEGYMEMAAWAAPQKAGYVKIIDSWLVVRMRHNAETGKIDLHTDDETRIKGFYAAYLELSTQWGR